MKKKKEKILRAVDVIHCPNCGAICSKDSLLKATKPEPFNSGLIWEEKHKCRKCETVYLIQNGTDW